MKARPILDRRLVLTPDAFAELVVWDVPDPVAGSPHGYKYRLALIVARQCVLRFDNEAGKGDHIHDMDGERPYRFETLDRLLGDFMEATKRWLDEHRGS